MEGHEGWDDYAPFYDWENRRTLGRRDVAFWRTLALQAGGPVLELGCGTGRISLPLARAGIPLIGIDRSAPMLAFARRRLRQARLASRMPLVQGDIRYLPFPSATVGPGPTTHLDSASLRPRGRRGKSAAPADAGGARLSSQPGARPWPVASLHGALNAAAPRAAARAPGDRTQASRRNEGPPASGPGFAAVLAPYGILQSLLREKDLASTLAEVHRVLRPGGTFGLELVADLPSWEEYRQRVSLSGWRGRPGGAHVTLVETVRQDRARRRTIFDQEFTERRGRERRVRRFSLAFRTLTVPQMARRLEAAGFAITALLGDYRGRAWDARADIWLILARRSSEGPP